MTVLHKVAAFITRGSGYRQQLLVIDHPDAGLQLPAGTVELNEDPDTAVIREVAEEAGVTAVARVSKLASFNQLQGKQRVMCETTQLENADFAFRRGWYVREIERAGDRVLVCYEEFEFVNQMPGKVVFSQAGWVPTTAVTDQLVRHLYHMRPTRPLPDEWRADPGDHGHAPWRLFWLPLRSAELVQGQQIWLDQVRAKLLCP